MDICEQYLLSFLQFFLLSFKKLKNNKLKKTCSQSVYYFCFQQQQELQLCDNISVVSQGKNKKKRQNILTIFGMSQYIDHAQILAVGTTVLDKPYLSAAISILLVKTNVFISFANALKQAVEEILYTRRKSHKSNHVSTGTERQENIHQNPLLLSWAFPRGKNQSIWQQLICPLHLQF